MPFFPEESKWKNIIVLSAFFALGILVVESIWTGLFVIIAITLSRFVAKEHESNATYFNEKELSEYNRNYYFAFYRMLMAATYVFVAFSHGYLVTLDIAFFLLWYIGYTLYWYTTFFIPIDGELSKKGRVLSSVGALCCGILVLGFVIWMLTRLEGFYWISSMVSEPISELFKI
ncbi:MAG: hypothetical protein ACPGUE_09860 [Marinomonas sp.]